MDDKLLKSLIPEPRLWRLAMRLDDGALSVILYSTVEEGSLIHRQIPLERGEGRLRSLEEAVYDNPLLLGDFDRVYCVVQTSCYMVVPTDAAAMADDCELMMSTAFPGFGGDILPSPTSDHDATILMGLDSDLSGFLNRTFLSPRIAHNLSPLSRYFAATSGKGNGLKACINLRRDSLDIVIIERGRLLLANTFSFRETDDALYYVLATLRQISDRPADISLFLAGDQAVRDRLMPRLREYVAQVAPVIFPSSMFRAGRDAMKVPFDLIAMTLCE